MAATSTVWPVPRQPVAAGEARVYGHAMASKDAHSSLNNFVLLS